MTTLATLVQAIRTTSLSQWPRTFQLLAASSIIAALATAVLWLQSPAYKVLFSNLPDRDGGAIVAALTQMNIPYQLSESGQAILVPSDKVHQTRLQLAQQGLPRSGEAGFELLDQTRFGSSQFTEQLTYQRGLEGELANSIQTLHAVQSARVHLALPKESLFVRERHAPTASVVVTLYPGRQLSAAQVTAITWLVSSSVPHLLADDVSIVDQNGRLLTAPKGESAADAARQHMVNEIEQRTVQRILSLLTPLVGAENVRAQASADVDFSHREQTSESYRPNQAQDQAAVRSKQTSTSTQHNVIPPEGVPGALSNQPPPNATAPIERPGNTTRQNNRGAAAGTASPTQEASRQNGASHRDDATVNYELDRTISHIKDPFGILRRLSVAVVVNFRTGEAGPEPLSNDEMEKLDQLVKQAMGYSEQRGDTLSIINSQFNDTGPQTPPFWENPFYINLALEIGRYLLILFIVLLIWRKIGKPLLSAAIANTEKNNEAASTDQDPNELARIADAAAAEKLARELNRYEDNLNTARDMAQKDPRAVAMVMRSWMEKENDNH